MNAKSRVLPYLLALPGIVWLLVFFVLPLLAQVVTSLSQGSLVTHWRFTWHWQNYANAFATYGHLFARSFGYAGLATLFTVLIGYPLAYFIVFRGGKWKLLLLFPVVVPFLITYLVRTVSWLALLSDGGLVVSFLKFLHVMSEDGFLIGTPAAVVFALAYNFLPFSVLPIYASLDKIDPTLLRAAADLYASPFVVFRKVVFPLSLPGVFAGSLLTFIPAAGDYVNAQMLGAPEQQMIGNAIQAQYMVTLNYPLAAAASILLMLSLLICVALYSRLFGTKDLTG
ncbi:MAG TPA: ABC transporter permease [Dongiaceae bacterium]